MDFNPQKIKLLNKLLNDVAGLEVLWFTGLENAPWFEDMDGAELVATADEVPVQYILQEGIVGEYLLRLGDDVPWVRVLLAEKCQWLPVLLDKVDRIAFVRPDLLMRLDIHKKDSLCYIYVKLLDQE